MKRVTKVNSKFSQRKESDAPEFSTIEVDGREYVPASEVEGMANEIAREILSENDCGCDCGCGGSSDLADPNLFSYYVDLDNRVIHIKGIMGQDEGENDYSHEIGLILRWNVEDEFNHIPPEKRNPIKILIDCCGGDTSVMWHLIDVIDASVTPVYTINMQKAFSAAGLLLVCGHAGKRYCMKHSAALVHDGSRTANGTNRYDFSAYVAFLNNVDKQAEDLLLERTSITPELISEWKGKETFLDAKTQLDLGMVDHILNNFGEIPWNIYEDESCTEDSE